MSNNNAINRRNFIKTAAAATTGFMFIKSGNVFGSEANSALRIGIIGCGGRGRADTTALVENTNSRMVALADLFSDQLEAAKNYYDGLAAKKGHPSIERRLMFQGPKAYQELASCEEVDVVVISSPDYFHIEHLNAAVNAGKHVYCEKPAGVDVVGCKRFAEIGKKAEGRLSLDVGFQVRDSLPFSGLVKRIHNGDIGKVACASTFYHFPGIDYPLRPNASPLERRIRNFYWDRILSGDVLVDQNIHIIDMCNWVLNAHPIKAVGTGGRKVRTDASDIWDHWDLVFTYPNDVKVSFNSVQFGKKFNDVGTRFFGDQGVGEAYYSGKARIVSDKPWDLQTWLKEQGSLTSGEFKGLGNATGIKVKAFVESIRSGNYHNQSAEGVESALSAILGRMAAYSGREISWYEMMDSNQSYQGEIDWSKL